MVPKLSAPLVKDIRTGEGIAEWLLGIVVAVLTSVGDLGVVKGATFLTVLAVAKGIRRGVIKAVGTLNPVAGIPAPQVDDSSDAIREIAIAAAAATRVQNQPGTPAVEVKAGLSPAPIEAAAPTVAPSA